jgi:hypothetical protein
VYEGKSIDCQLRFATWLRRTKPASVRDPYGAQECLSLSATSELANVGTAGPDAMDHESVPRQFERLNRYPPPGMGHGDAAGPFDSVRIA